MSTKKIFKNPKIAVIPGDGIGKEVMPEGLRALEAANRKFNLGMQFDHFDFASCDYYVKHGKMMPDDWFDTLMKYDAIFFGAVGMPDILPDHVSLWGSLIQFRRGFDQYVNLRPVRLLPGVPCPLAIVSQAISTFLLCAKIQRVNIQVLAEKCSPTLIVSL